MEGHQQTANLCSVSPTKLGDRLEPTTSPHEEVTIPTPSFVPTIMTSTLSPSPPIDDVKIRFNLKDPVIRLHRLPDSVWTKEVTDVRPINQGNCSTKRNLATNSRISSKVARQSAKNPTVAFDAYDAHSVNTGSCRGNQWDSSFFLHMNRYRPEESCFFTPPNPVIKPTQILFQETTAQPKSAVPPPPYGNDKQIHAKGGESWKCDYCSRTFNYKWNMITHLLVHTGEKPFVCPFCIAEFRQKSHAVRHIAVNHPYRFQDQTAVQNSGNDTGSCAFCGEELKEITLLRKHILHYHSDRVVPSK